jgi:hypothetical protein
MKVKGMVSRSEKKINSKREKKMKESTEHKTKERKEIFKVRNCEGMKN